MDTQETTTTLVEETTTQWVLRTSPAIKFIAHPLGYAAQIIATRSGPNWSTWVIFFLQELEKHTTPFHFAETLESVKASVEDKLDGGEWT